LERLKGKVAIITGATAGIGKAIAKLFAEEGAIVVVVGRNSQAAEERVREIESTGHQALAIRCDISSISDIQNMVNKTLERFEKIDILVNNAAVDHSGRATEISGEDWDTLMNINQKGTFRCCQAVGKHMIAKKAGKIINVISVMAHAATPDKVLYCTSKGAVLQLTRQLAVEWGPYNINVNAVSPGLTINGQTTENLKRSPNDINDRLKRLPLRRVNKPIDVAYAVLFLASYESDNITGQALVVDGGALALHPGYSSPPQE
jgi:NAD(P)-dependent dehydrogenase (short-subunit alcohol dehydrogenase family)